MGWFVVFGIVSVAVIASSVLLLSRDHLPVRFIDVDASWLRRDAAGRTRLHLVLRSAPATGQLDHEVRPATETHPLTVVLRRSAAGHVTQRPDDPDAPPPGRRILELALPDVVRVRVLDRRFGRTEAHVFEREDGP